LRIWDTARAIAFGNAPPKAVAAKSKASPGGKAKGPLVLTITKGFDYFPSTAAFNLDGTCIATQGSSDFAVLVRDAVKTGKILRRLRGHTFPIEDIAYSHDGKFIASASSDGTVRLWSAGVESESKCLLVLSNVVSVNSLAFSHDDMRIACGYEDGQVRVWDAVTFIV
jgi:hypothetical protein